MVETVDRNRYAGLTPSEAATLAVADYAARIPLRPTTRTEKAYVLGRILEDLRQKGRDLSNVDQETLRGLRDYYGAKVEQDKMSENYAYNLVKEWNALMGALFGDKKKPGEGLRMKSGFRQTPRQVEVLDVEDYDGMLAQVANRKWMGVLNRGAVVTYLEIAMSTAGRSKSILSPQATFKNIDYEKGVYTFWDVKNIETGDFLQVVLTDRCVERLRTWESELRRESRWSGPETPIMQAERGILTYQSLLKALKDLAALAGLKKPVTTHVLRKSTGTHMARKDRKLAREQLGITQKIFDLHYDQPRLKDRLEQRDIIPGASATYATMEVKMGQLTRQFREGKISEEEWKRELTRLELQDATRPASKGHDPSVV
ncbi:MAG TPA: tyrosine-type recombinase/integrase [Candidatus Thermoplasmatota archaeon]|nr:tyrosine-type recombinase/integrase [Candidatus Thermoplasmatota archaeon]